MARASAPLASLEQPAHVAQRLWAGLLAQRHWRQRLDLRVFSQEPVQPKEDSVFPPSLWVRHSAAGLGLWSPRTWLRGNKPPAERAIRRTLTSNSLQTGCQTRSGLAVLLIKYSDGSGGTLIVSCHQPVGSPSGIFEGITATKGFVAFHER